MKIFDIKGNATIYQKIALAIVGLILLILLTYGIKSINVEKPWVDYKSATPSTFINTSTTVTDRDKYWTLNDIIFKFLNSCQTQIKFDTSEMIEYNYEGYSLKEYYDVIDDTYKKYLKKSDFIKLSEEIVKKVYGTNENGVIMKSEDIIANIYKLSGEDNKYICALKTTTENEYAYIGITLDEDKKTFSIFYLK